VMMWVDYIIIAVCAVFVANGFRKGFVQEIMGILGLVLAILFALRYFEDVGQIISARFSIPENLANVMGFVVLSLAIAAVVSIVAIAWKRVIGLSSLSVLDKIFGAGFGLVKGGLVITIILLALVSLQMPAVHDILLVQSPVAKEVLTLAPRLYERLEPLLPSSMDGLMITPEGFKILRDNVDSEDGTDEPSV
jgi:membrane protein required for colicin V production